MFFGVFIHQDGPAGGASGEFCVSRVGWEDVWIIVKAFLKFQNVRAAIWL